MTTPTVDQLLQSHVSLSISCIDRLYINAYLANLQTPWQLIAFMRDVLMKPIPSLALMNQLRLAFIKQVHAFVNRHGIPLITFAKGQRKDDIVAPFRAKYTRPHGVVLVGVGQERTSSFRTLKGNHISRQSAFVNHYYFYLQDRDWGPGFIKVCSYAPFPGKLCINGHEWAKQQLAHAGISFESLDNGFRSCDDPERLQRICDSLGPMDVQGFFDRWMHVLPWPLDLAAQHAGYRHSLSIRQMEVSLTQVFERPVHGRYFFEQVIRDNLDLGRPHRVSLIFPTRYSRQTPPPRSGYRTRVITDGIKPSLHVEYKRSHIKQYFKEGRALRTETTINEPADFGLPKGIHKAMRPLKTVGEDLNRKLLTVERVSEDCTLSSEELDRMQRPTLEQGQRASALRFGDLRVMALLQALCLFLHIPGGFRNRDLRIHVAGLMGLEINEYSTGRMTYDLRRLRLKGLIRRIPGSHSYAVTPIGTRVAYFYSKVYARILRPAWASLGEPTEPVPRKLRQAFAKVEAEIATICDTAGLKEAA